MSHRSPGDSSIVQRPNGTYQVSLQISGRRKTLYARSEREAKKKLRELQAQVQNGTLPQEGVHALRRQKVQQNEWRLKSGENWQNTGYVFTIGEGRPLYQYHIQHLMRDQCHKLGLPALGPHGLRHLHASLLLSEGLPLTDVSARLGHANANITAGIYAHVIPGRDIEAARSMESVLRQRD
ncbi:MAG: tyrosine-type recombinase/integrase [Chloroflexi bacterium]|nr:tyrosine-type recombinase/integrase [Chloroflexota bacterium]